MSNKRLNLEFDIPNLVMALFLLKQHKSQKKIRRNVQKRIEKSELIPALEIPLKELSEKEKQMILSSREDEGKKNEGLFGYAVEFIGYEEGKVVNILTNFLSDNLLEKIVATKYKALSSIDREVSEIRKIKKENLELVTPFDMPVPFIKPYEFDEADENDEYWSYEIKVNPNELDKYIENILSLWRENKYMHTAIKSEKQIEQTLGFIKKKLIDFNPENLWIEEFENPRIFNLPATLLEIEKLGYLRISDAMDFVRVSDEGKVRMNVDILEKSTNSFQSIQFNDLGHLIFGEKRVIELPPLQRSLCKALCEAIPLYKFNTFDLEESVYGGLADKKRQAKFKKLSQDTNKRVCREFNIPDFINYGSDETSRLV